MDIQSWIVNWFRENTLAETEELMNGLDMNYFDSGWLDSIGFISFLTDLEKQFSVEFENDAFQEREFSTIAGLAKILEGLI